MNLFITLLENVNKSRTSADTAALKKSLWYFSFTLNFPMHKKGGFL
jgi:hypothetical protein